MAEKGIVSYPSYQHRIWPRVLLYDKELVPHPASLGAVQDLSLLAPVAVAVQRGPGALGRQPLAAAQHPQAQQSRLHAALRLHFWLARRHRSIRGSTPSTLAVRKSGATEECQTNPCAHRMPPRIKHITLMLCSFPAPFLQEGKMEKIVNSLRI